VPHLISPESEFGQRIRPISYDISIRSGPDCWNLGISVVVFVNDQFFSLSGVLGGTFLHYYPHLWPVVTAPSVLGQWTAFRLLEACSPGLNWQSSDRCSATRMANRHYCNEFALTAGIALLPSPTSLTPRLTSRVLRHIPPSWAERTTKPCAFVYTYGFPGNTHTNEM
jgi:hypothetical protein